MISANEAEFPASPTVGERIDFVFAFLRRRYLSILIGLLVCLPFGAMYLFTTPRPYTATATMMIETRQSGLESVLGGAPPQSARAASQRGALRPSDVAQYVVKQRPLPR